MNQSIVRSKELLELARNLACADVSPNLRFRKPHLLCSIGAKSWMPMETDVSISYLETVHGHREVGLTETVLVVGGEVGN